VIARTGKRKSTSKQAPLLLRNTLLVSALIFAVLEWWRPYFFLTTTSRWRVSPLQEVGRRASSGPVAVHLRSPFRGGYNSSRPGFFVWHPLFCLYRLPGRPFTTAIIDVDAFALLMLATAGFVTLAIICAAKCPANKRRLDHVLRLASPTP